MDVVIPYKNSAANGLELRYTLRGIEKYFPDLENVFIIGDCPGFLQNIIHIPVCESPERHYKQRNIFSKLCISCEDRRVSDSFAWISDDEFLMVPYQLNYNYCSTLEDSINRLTVHQTYRHTLINTLNVLGGGFEYGHNPIIFDKEKLIRAAAGLHWNIAWGFAIKSIYCGYNGITSDHFPDLKIKMSLSYNEISALVKGRPYFSIDDRAFNDDMKLFLQCLFPQKSIYEND